MLAHFHLPHCSASGARLDLPVATAEVDDDEAGDEELTPKEVTPEVCTAQASVSDCRKRARELSKAHVMRTCKSPCRQTSTNRLQCSLDAIAPCHWRDRLNTMAWSVAEVTPWCMCKFACRLGQGHVSRAGRIRCHTRALSASR